MEIWPYLLAVPLGLVVLGWSADRFVDGASGLSVHLGVSPMVVGLTVVAFGTSAPEMFVSAFAAWQGSPGLAIGNALGSNIANVALVLAAAALVAPLSIHSQTLRREIPLMFVVMAFAFLLLRDGELSRFDGVLLIAGILGFTGWSLWLARRTRYTDPLQQEFAKEVGKVDSVRRAWWWLLSGLLLLVVSSRLLVWGASGIATALSISDLVIGLSIVAVGTSLPELAAAIAAARKGESDMVVGNIVGSNIFNLLAVLGIAGAIQSAPVSNVVLYRDFPLMAGVSLAVVALAYGIGKPGHVGRGAGGALLAVFFCYQFILFLKG